MATMVADTACIDPRADIADDVEIGPYCVIGPDVRIGRGTRLIAHVCILGHTSLGEENVVHPFAVIGGDPQDYSYKGEPTRVEIGDRNMIREAVTIHRASAKEEGVTRIGSNNFLMASTHVGHDCVLGDRILVANNTMFAGHIHVESFATISGGVGLHQFVSVGAHSYIGGLSRIVHDVPPLHARGRQPVEGSLHQRGWAEAAERDLPGNHLAARGAPAALPRRMTAQQAAEVLESHDHLCPEVRRLLDFIEVQQQGKHGRARERGRS